MLSSNMKTFLFALILFPILVGLSFVIFPVSPKTIPVPNARTVYSGWVEISPVTIHQIETALKAKGCVESTWSDEIGRCFYSTSRDENTGEQFVSIYPNGQGFGPISFNVGVNRLYGEKDIPGTPDPEKYYAKVREDAAFIGDIISIQEDGWEITRTDYPFTAIY